MEKKESPKEERAVKPVISLPSKNEYKIDNKYQEAKIKNLE